jgi:hypothetical protein
LFGGEYLLLLLLDLVLGTGCLQETLLKQHVMTVCGTAVVCSHLLLSQSAPPGDSHAAQQDLQAHIGMRCLITHVGELLVDCGVSSIEAQDVR